MSRWLSDYLRMVGVSLQPKFHLASHRPVLVPLWPSSSFSSNLSNDKAAMMLWWISHYFIDLNKVQKLCIKKVKVYNVWKLLMISIKILINHWSYPANERLTFWHRKTLFHWTLCFYISLILCFLWVLKIIYDKLFKLDFSKETGQRLKWFTECGRWSQRSLVSCPCDK